MNWISLNFEQSTKPHDWPKMPKSTTAIVVTYANVTYTTEELGRAKVSMFNLPSPLLGNLLLTWRVDGSTFFRREMTSVILELLEKFLGFALLSLTKLMTHCVECSFSSFNVHLRSRKNQLCCCWFREPQCQNLRRFCDFCGSKCWRRQAW